MADRKYTKKYVFTVEGETEQWYLYWLRDQINGCAHAAYHIQIIAPVQQNPWSYAKTVSAKTTPKITHLCDRESSDREHVQKFEGVLASLSRTRKEKRISCALGYSNYSFELWLLLHKINCSGPLTSRAQYLARINQAFGERFESMAKYKEETNFKRCLKKLTLADVRDAIRRAQAIMAQNQADGKRELEYGGFRYYPDNPSLTVQDAVEEILRDCKLL